MRKMFILAGILAALAGGALAQADRPDPRADEYRGWMQSIQPGVRSLTTSLNGKMGDAAASDADKLDATFKQVEDFWGQRNVQDAVAFTQTARKALRAISKEAKAGKLEYRTDRGANVHIAIGKKSFDEKALIENYGALLDEIVRAKPSASKGRYIRKITLTTTMGPGIHVDTTRTRDITEELSDETAREAVTAG